MSDCNSTTNTAARANNIGEAEAQNRTSHSKGDGTNHRVMSPETIIVDEAPPAPDYPRYRVRPGEPIVLADVDPDTERYKKKKHVEENLSIQRDRQGITSTSVCGEPAQPC